MNWKYKKVAITGATGFIGSWLTEDLVTRGAEVTILVRKDSPRGIRVLGKYADKVKIIYGDVREYDTIRSFVSDKDYIFHLAAITQVLYSTTHPVDTFNIDANGTLNILEAIRASSSQPFLIFQSTDKVYGEPNYVPIDERCGLSSKSPYDASKIAADRLVNSYFTSYGLKGTILRPSNVIGGRDANIWRAVPDFVLSIINNKPPTIRGNGKHIRDYTYVSDTVAAIRLAAEKQTKSNGEVFNIGTGKPTSVLDLSNLLIEVSGMKRKMKPVLMNKNTPSEIYKQYLTSAKARKLLGWVPKVSLKEGLKKTFEWYIQNPWWLSVIKDVEKYYSI